ncbi:hypothetical protein GCM10007880_67660 [Mesorhizobium amorphae]|nr:hypothetical protein GCM10007880_67660 [Mesorhizobium amorphae]
MEDLASYYRVHRVTVLKELAWWVDRLKEEDPDAYGVFQWDFDGVREFDERRHYTRRKAGRPMLAPWQQGEERLTGRRYSRPDPLIPRILALPPFRRPAIALAAE